MISRPLTFLLVAAATGVAFADTVKLKSGEVVEGKIVQTEGNSIVVEVQFSPTITDQRTIAKADIETITRVKPDEGAYSQIIATGFPETARDTAEYQKILDEQLQPFVTKYPYSTHLADVQDRIKKCEADITRLNGGEVKMFGFWYTPEQLTAEKYQIDAATLLAAMKQKMAAQDYAAVLDGAELLQRTYPNSAAFAESIPLIDEAFEKFAGQLRFAINNLPQVLANRQQTIDRTPPEQRAPVQEAFAAEDARSAAAADAAQKRNEHFYTIFPSDQKGMTSMRDALNQLNTQFKQIDKRKLATAARLVRRLNGEIADHQYEAAATTVAQLKSAWPEYEALARVDQRVQAALSDQKN